MPNSLQHITDAWGSWMNSKYNGGGVKFTSSTDYDDHSELDDYHSHQTSATITSMVYDPNAPAPGPGSVDSVATTFNNSTSVQQSYTYQQTETTQQSFTWTITEALSVGVEVSATEGVPEVAQVGEKVTTTINFSSTQGITINNTQSWSVTHIVVAPPHSTIQAMMVVATQDYDINWRATCNLVGSVAIWFKNKIAVPGSNGSHNLYFYPIQQVFKDCINNNITDTSGYQVNSSSVSALSTGVFRGGQGTSVDINMTQTDQLSQGTMQMSIPIDETGASAVISSDSAAA
jgi:hypothetical protein